MTNVGCDVLNVAPAIRAAILQIEYASRNVSGESFLVETFFNPFIACIDASF